MRNRTVSARQRRRRRTASAFQSFLVSAPNPTLSEADVTVEVAHGDVGLEARALAGRRLLLHGLDSHNFVLQFSGRRREEVVDDLVLLDRPEFGKNSPEKRSEHTEGAVEVERSKLKISSGLWPKHAVKEDLLERADPTLLYEAAELGDRTVWKTTGE